MKTEIVILPLGMVSPRQIVQYKRDGYDTYCNITNKLFAAKRGLK